MSTDAKNNTDFVSWMKKCDMQEWNDNQDFMKGYSERKFTFEKIALRPDNEDVFVDDLQKNNLLKIEENSRGPIFGFLKKN